MTKAQEKTLNKIKGVIPEFDFFCSNGYEVKEWIEYEPYLNGMFMVSFTTGMKDDEGTLASVFCRKHRMFWVGVRGGIYILNSNQKMVSTTIFDLMNKHHF